MEYSDLKRFNENSNSRAFLKFLFSPFHISLPPFITVLTRKKYTSPFN